MSCPHCNDTGSVEANGQKRPCAACRPVETDATPPTGKGRTMKNETKAITVEKMDGAGKGLARIATLSAIDSDGDTYVPGAFSWKEGGEQWVPILPAHQRTAMPLGKARIYEDGDAALAELHLNLDTQVGRDWHKTLKFDLEHGASVQEYSYGFGTLDHVIENRDGERVRVLKRLDVHEISPVVRGAGVGTGTLALKSHGSFADQIEAVILEIGDIVARAGSVKALREAQGREMSAERMEQLDRLKQRLDALLKGAPDPDAEAAPAGDEAKARAEAERLAADWLTRDARRRTGR
ncbi:HK97 family phage prohead protease [Polymorphum gilvum]|uniref:Prohead serine protease domain-containing protein n=1 Tax=Polymorphum gilvum (strain LMG 25793 / CGMCC 1.9160 / SL003B-26A1) TaxID=991905 RepID=F2J5M5_POLGS|nr:HK97 family phage prohead protease [Polymorphum gilvum]ADZ70109.1 hypothetical protein SL003B_1681 [Polymorphum gilvum SL003B-26A1]